MLPAGSSWCSGHLFRARFALAFAFGLPFASFIGIGRMLILAIWIIAMTSISVLKANPFASRCVLGCSAGKFTFQRLHFLFKSSYMLLALFGSCLRLHGRGCLGWFDSTCLTFRLWRWPALGAAAHMGSKRSSIRLLRLQLDQDQMRFLPRLRCAKHCAAAAVIPHVLVRPDLSGDRADLL